MADVNVTFAAVDEGFTSGIEKMRTEESRLATGVPRTVGGAGIPGTVESGGRVYRQLTDQEREAAKAANELAEAEEGVSQATQRSGINFGRLVERMAFSMAIYGAMRLAIQGVKAAMDEFTSSEATTTRFKALTTDTASANAELDKMADTATKIGAKKEDLAGLNLSLQESGASAHDAGIETETLADYAGVAGEKMGPLGEMMNRLKIGAGTIADMEHLVALTGAGGNALRDRIVNLQKEEVSLSRNEQEMVRMTQLQQRAFELQEKHTEAVTDFSDKLGIARDVFQQLSTGQIGRGIYEIKGGVDLTEQADLIAKREEAGEKQLGVEEKLSLHQVRQLEQAGLINDKDLLAAAQRVTAADQLAKRNAEEDARYERRHAQEMASLELQKEVFGNITQRVGLDTNLAELQKTIANQQASAAEELKKTVDNSNTVKAITGAWVESLKDASHTLKQIDQFTENIKKGNLGGALGVLYTPDNPLSRAINSPKGSTSDIFGTYPAGESKAVQLLEGIHAALTAP